MDDVSTRLTPGGSRFSCPARRSGRPDREQAGQRRPGGVSARSGGACSRPGVSVPDGIVARRLQGADGVLDGLLDEVVALEEADEEGQPLVCLQRHPVTECGRAWLEA
jgi:hypothetical protein